MATDWEDRAHESQPDHPFFRTPPQVDNNSKILFWQKAFVDKILDIAFNYDNVLYIINNETSAMPEWGEFWVKYVKEFAQEKGNQ